MSIHLPAAADLRFPVTAESGDFPIRDITRRGEECPYFRIEPALMPRVDD